MASRKAKAVFQAMTMTEEIDQRVTTVGQLIDKLARFDRNMLVSPYAGDNYFYCIADVWDAILKVRVKRTYSGGKTRRLYKDVDVVIVG